MLPGVRSKASFRPSPTWATSFTPGVADADTYRRLLLSLPEVEEGTGHGRPAWRVRGKFFAGLRDDGATAVLKVDKGEKQLLMEAEPDIFFETPHYEGWGYFLVRLGVIEEDELAEVVEDAWRLAAPKRLVRARDEGAVREEPTRSR